MSTTFDWFNYFSSVAKRKIRSKLPANADEDKIIKQVLRGSQYGVVKRDSLHAALSLNTNCNGANADALKEYIRRAASEEEAPAPDQCPEGPSLTEVNTSSNDDPCDNGQESEASRLSFEGSPDGGDRPVGGQP
jgi:hypothetical protein